MKIINRLTLFCEAYTRCTSHRGHTVKTFKLPNTPNGSYRLKELNDGRRREFLAITGHGRRYQAPGSKACVGA